jgi:hypothetical protein
MNKFKVCILRNFIYRSPYLLSNNLINKSRPTLSHMTRCSFSSKNNNDQEYEVIDDEPNGKQPNEQKFPKEKSFFARSAIPLSLLAASGICFTIGIIFFIFFIKIMDFYSPCLASLDSLDSYSQNESASS